MDVFHVNESGRRKKNVKQCVNNLAYTNPELAKEWNYEKNRDLSPESITVGSSKKVWWKCSTCGYVWSASVANRSKGHRCPVCMNRTVVKGVNDLATTNPELAKEWNYEKNGSLNPQDIIAGSPKKVWWKCEKGHEWQATIVSRNKNVHCPVCFSNRNTSMSEKAVGYYLEKYGVEIEENKKIGRRELDIYIPNLKMAIEYDGVYYHTDISKDLEKNKKCKELGIKLIRLRELGLPVLNSTSIDVQIGDMKSDYSHLDAPISEVLAVILGVGEYNIDLKRDYGEIYSRYQMGEVERSLANMYKSLLKEWDYGKNTVDPQIVSPSSHYMAWWKCSVCGNEWKASVYSRAKEGTGCRLCGYKRIGAKNAALKDDKISFAIKYPELAKEWNYEKNRDLKPDRITPRSNKKVWWKCSSCGKEWETTVYNRTRRALLRCSDCNRKRAGAANAVPKNGLSFAAKYPELMKEWNYEKNGDLRPDRIAAKSHKKVWWKCLSCGKEWETTVYNRTRRVLLGCSDCSRKMKREKNNGKINNE